MKESSYKNHLTYHVEKGKLLVVLVNPTLFLDYRYSCFFYDSLYAPISWG